MLIFRKKTIRDFPMVQWLKLHAPNAGGTGLIMGQRNKILYAAWYSQKKKKKEYHDIKCLKS